MILSLHRQLGGALRVKSPAAFFSKLVFPDPRLPKTMWCRLLLALSKVPEAGSTKRGIVSSLARVDSSIRMDNIVIFCKSRN